MKDVLRSFWHSSSLWIFVASWSVTMLSIVFLAVWLQRAEYQRQVDLSALRSVEQIKQAIRELKAQDDQSAKDRTKIKRDLDEVKSQVREEMRP